MLGTDFAGQKEYDKWLQFVRDAFSCMDFSSQTITWKQLPAAGGYYDQDVFIFSIWENIRLMANGLKDNEDFLNQVAIRKKIKDKQNGKN